MANSHPVKGKAKALTTTVPGRSPALADIAAAAGVSISTVSLALRQNPRISEETRARVQAEAVRLKYRPDPSLGKLMEHLRRRRTTTFQGSLCALHFMPAKDENSRHILQAAEARAEELGYGVVHESISAEPEACAKLERSLISRGIEALLLLPCALPKAIPELLHWEHFAVVAAGYNPIEPSVDRVVVDWHEGVRSSMQALYSHGCRRLGLVAGFHFDFMFRHGLSGALSEFLFRSDAKVVKPCHYVLRMEARDRAWLAPRFVEVIETELAGCGAERLAELVDRWLTAERPDAVVFDYMPTYQAALPVLRRHRFAPKAVSVLTDGLGINDGGSFTYSRKLGEIAVDALHAKVMHGEYGLPSCPVEHLLKVNWRAQQRVRCSTFD